MHNNTKFMEGCQMTNAEFQKELKRLYSEHPMIAKRKQKTFNELVYVLRMSGEDYQINTIDKSHPGTFCGIPGVQETFIPVKSLAQKVLKVELDEETYEEMGIKLLIVTVKD